MKFPPLSTRFKRVPLNDIFRQGTNMNVRTLSCLVLLSGVLPALAQQAPVLKEDQVTESALIDALTPSEPVRTRSLVVRRDEEAAVGKPAQASLLITFDTNSAVLTNHATQALDVMARALASSKLSDFRFAIEGHADPRGASAANLKLSQLRAESVRDYLVNEKHIERSRLDPVGKGDRNLMNKANPAAPENRRVTFVNLAK